MEGLAGRIQRAVLGTARKAPPMEHVLECASAEQCDLVVRALLLAVSALEGGAPIRNPKRSMPGTSADFFAKQGAAEAGPVVPRRGASLGRGGLNPLSEVEAPPPLFASDVPYLEKQVTYIYIYICVFMYLVIYIHIYLYVYIYNI